MDFRDNWLAHFRAAVDLEIKSAGGDVASGRKAFASVIGKNEQTVYQHYAQKSKKVYPTVEMMVALEKKYGAGRPVGWASLPLKQVDLAEPTRLIPNAPGIHYIGRVLAGKLAQMAPEDRELAGDMLKKLAMKPEDPTRVIEALASYLGEIEVEPLVLTGTDDKQ